MLNDTCSRPQQRQNERMTVFLEHGGHEFLNLGDTSMLQTAFYRLKEFWPEAIIYIFTNSEKRLADYCPGAIPIDSSSRIAWLKVNNMGIFPRRLTKWLTTHLRQKFTKIETNIFLHCPKFSQLMIKSRAKFRGVDIEPTKAYKYISTLLNSDVVLATGGGYLTDDFKWLAHRVLETILLAIEYGKTTALFGQGIGPVHDEKLKQQMSLILPKVDLICLREKLCGLPILLELGVQDSKIITTGDDAIELAHQERKNGIGNMIGVNLRATDYSGVDDQIKGDISDVLRLFAEQQQAHLVPIPISFHDHGEDIRAIKAIISCSKDIWDEATRLDSPRKVINRVGDCRVVVTGSYHAGVFALSQGIPVIGIAKSQYYKDKFQGLADQFEGGCKVVLMDDPDRKRIFSSNLHQFWTESSSLRESLLVAAKGQIARGQLAYEQLRYLAESNKASRGRAKFN